MHVGAAWGIDGAFASLLVMALGRNNLTGSLPAAWGAGNGLPSLQSFVAWGTGINGSLPESWSFQLSLTVINLAFTKITGKLQSSADVASAKRHVNLLLQRMPRSGCSNTRKST